MFSKKLDIFSGALALSRSSGAFAGRLAAILYFLYGITITATTPLTVAPGVPGRAAVVIVGVLATVTGLASWYLPWQRWKLSVTLVLPIAAFLMIAFLNSETQHIHSHYASLFLVVFSWLGLCHRRGMSTLLLPIASASYLIPLVLLAHQPLGTTLASLAYLVPSWWFLGETIAWVSERLITTETSLQASERSFKRLFAENPQPMWIYDVETSSFLEVNQGAIELFGYGRDEFLAMRVIDLSVPAGSASSSASYYTKVGTVVETNQMQHHFTFAGRPAILASISDVTKQKELEAELQYRASHDPLTGLANGSELLSFLNGIYSQISSGTLEHGGLSMFLIGLQRFKDVNYGLGHSFGEDVLREIASRLTSELPYAKISARMGSDEFAVVVGNNDYPENDKTAQALFSAIGKALYIGGITLRLDANMGIVEIPGTAINATESLRNADIALFRAKREQKGWITYTPEEKQDRVETLILATDLKEALEHDSLTLAFQPEIDLISGRVHSVEALSRWTHPRRGMIAPQTFIPIAEQTGSIYNLTAWAIDSALQTCNKTMSEGLGVPISINVSSSLLREPDFVKLVRESLERSGLSGEMLVCEITESALIERMADSLKTLHALKDLGVRISLDDFGTGYSSFAYLKDLPIDELKIDQSFIYNLSTDSSLRKIVQGIIELSRAMSIEVVAEGIQDENTLNTLVAMGCDFGQGYLYGQAMRESDLLEWLRGHTSAVGPSDAGPPP